MATELMRVRTEDGEEVFFEIRRQDTGFGEAGLDEHIVEARRRFETGLREINIAAQKALATFRAAAHRPDDIEIEFGVNFTAEAGAVFAKTGMDAHLTVKLTWSAGPPPGEAPAR
ncbi:MULTISPECIES: CU044_2847 family protein [unclassified Micromonospora]|uniref:CU044_2847 family protein n=1 Tax=unclassified Micromonospora TaxID=2617518 RepID=UPI0033FC9420